jgi:hypothetical protein
MNINIRADTATLIEGMRRAEMAIASLPVDLKAYNVCTVHYPDGTARKVDPSERYIDLTEKP